MLDLEIKKQRNCTLSLVASHRRRTKADRTLRGFHMKQSRNLGKRKNRVMTVFCRRKKRIKCRTEKIDDSLRELLCFVWKLSLERKSGDCFYVNKREKFVFSSTCAIICSSNNERMPISFSIIILHRIAWYFLNSSNCISDFSLPDIIKISRFPFTVFFSNRITVKLSSFCNTSKNT